MAEPVLNAELQLPGLFGLGFSPLFMTGCPGGEPLYQYERDSSIRCFSWSEFAEHKSRGMPSIQLLLLHISTPPKCQIHQLKLPLLYHTSLTLDESLQMGSLPIPPLNRRQTQPRASHRMPHSNLTLCKRMRTFKVPKMCSVSKLYRKSPRSLFTGSLKLSIRSPRSQRDPMPHTNYLK